MKRILQLAVIFILTAGLFQANTVLGQFFYIMENPLIGEKAPDFNLSLTNGKTETLNNYRDGQNAIIFYWATWCPNCKAEIIELNEMSDDLAKKDIKVVLIDLEEPAKKVNKYLKKYDITLDVFLDENADVAEAYDLIGVPTYYFVTKDGVIQAVEHSLPEDLESIFNTQS